MSNENTRQLITSPEHSRSTFVRARDSLVAQFQNGAALARVGLEHDG